MAEGGLLPSDIDPRIYARLGITELYVEPVMDDDTDEPLAWLAVVIMCAHALDCGCGTWQPFHTWPMPMRFERTDAIADAQNVLRRMAAAFTEAYPQAHPGFEADESRPQPTPAAAKAAWERIGAAWRDDVRAKASSAPSEPRRPQRQSRRPPSPPVPDSRELEAWRQQVRTLREARGWSQADLGREIGTSQAQVSQIERGVGTVRTDDAQKLCELLGLTPPPGA